MSERRTQFGYGKLFQGALIGCMVFFVSGCGTLFDRVPSVPGDTNSPALYQPSTRVTNLVEQTGSAFGPIGQLAAGAALIALHAGALILNQKRVVKNALQEHTQFYHDPGQPGPDPSVDVAALALEIVKLLGTPALKPAAPPG